jgi:hypothetical protein
MDEDLRRQLERDRVDRLRDRITTKAALERPCDKFDIRPLSADEIDERIRAAIAEHHAHIKELLVGLTAKVMDNNARDLEYATRLLTAELCDARATLAEFTAALARRENTTAPVDVPRPLRPRGLN